MENKTHARILPLPETNIFSPWILARAPISESSSIPTIDFQGVPGEG